MDYTLLDRPVWSAISSGWSHLAEGDGQALRLDPDYGPFGAAAGNGPENLAALERVIPPGGEVWLVQREGIAAPPGTAIRKCAAVTQMVADTILPAQHMVSFEPLV